jgi:hypothetical protein
MVYPRGRRACVLCSWLVRGGKGEPDALGNPWLDNL